MPRPAVFAEQFTGSQVGVTLREHREDREALLTSLLAFLQADVRVRAVWLWGSFQNGEADDLSDLDLWVIVADETVFEMGTILQDYAQQTSNFISGGEAPHLAPPQGGFFASRHEGRHGLLHLDCYWQALSAMETVTDFFQKAPDAERVYLIHRLDAPASFSSLSLQARKQPAPLTQRENDINNGIGFAWLMFSIAAKYLARFPDSDMALMQYPKPGLESTAILLGMEALLKMDDWVTPDEPIEKLRCLRHLVDKTAQLTEAANKQGMSFSLLHAICLGRYLDMIEGVLIARM